MDLLTITNQIPIGATVFMRRRSWVNPVMIKGEKLESGGLVLSDFASGEVFELSTACAIADDWDYVQ